MAAARTRPRSCDASDQPRDGWEKDFGCLTPPTSEAGPESGRNPCVNAKATANAQGPLVVVVDDQPFFRAHLRNELARQGQTVVTAGDAEEALRLVDELGPPLIVILDLMLPGTSGPELLHELARRHDADRLRFILVSAHQVLAKVAPNHRLVVARLGKPVDATLLAAHVQAAAASLRDSES